jgi:hypothetical protein
MQSNTKNTKRKNSIPTGLFLAHLGPSPVSPSSSSSRLEEKQNSKTTNEIDESFNYYTYKAPNPYPSIKSTEQNLTEQNATSKVSRRRSPSFLQKPDWRSFKRRDIMNWRKEFFPELQQKYEMMEATRSSLNSEDRSSFEEI